MPSSFHLKNIHQHVDHNASLLRSLKRKSYSIRYGTTPSSHQGKYLSHTPAILQIQASHIQPPHPAPPPLSHHLIPEELPAGLNPFRNPTKMIEYGGFKSKHDIHIQSFLLDPDKPPFPSVGNRRKKKIGLFLFFPMKYHPLRYYSSIFNCRITHF